MFVRLFVLFAVAIAPIAARAQNAVLEKIRQDVITSYNKQERPIVVFDLDGTLFDNRSRTVQILKEYAEQELKQVRPEAAQKLLLLTPALASYTPGDTMNKVGVTEAAVVNNGAVFWSQRFFNDDYLRYDQPTPGSVNYVRTLYSSGARIVYLTGRDVPRQLIGTVKALRDLGYPIGMQGTELIMKPKADEQDAVFKQRVITHLRLSGKIIATFDSEPENANMFRRTFADAQVLLFEAPRKPNPPQVMPNITPLLAFQ
jgi:hypothetical protein